MGCDTTANVRRSKDSTKDKWMEWVFDVGAGGWKKKETKEIENFIKAAKMIPSNLYPSAFRIIFSPGNFVNVVLFKLH